MLLDLTEVVACPACGAGQGLIALVEELDGGRLRTGQLGCPNCRRRYRVEHGVADLSLAAGSHPKPGRLGGTGLPTESPESGNTDHVLIAAALELQTGSGAVLLDEELSPLAPHISELAAGVEVVALYPADQSVGAATAHTAIVIDSGALLPFLERRFRGAAVVHIDRARLDELRRVLAPGARLVVLAPAPCPEPLLESAGFEPFAADERALLVTRA